MSKAETKLDATLAATRRRILSDLPIKRTEEMYKYMKAEQVRTNQPMPNEIETLFDQLDAKLAELQASLTDKPGHYHAYLVAFARKDLARVQRWVRHAIEREEAGKANIM